MTSIPAPMQQQSQVLQIIIKKGDKGFGFTITDSSQGQRIKQILDESRCRDFQVIIKLTIYGLFSLTQMTKYVKLFLLELRLFLLFVWSVNYNIYKEQSQNQFSKIKIFGFGDVEYFINFNRRVIFYLKSMETMFRACHIIM